MNLIFALIACAASFMVGFKFARFSQKTPQQAANIIANLLVWKAETDFNDMLFRQSIIRYADSLTNEDITRFKKTIL